jgi:inhibitor of cysteine peptidase
MMTRRNVNPRTTLRAASAAVALMALASCATLNREGSVAPLDGGSVSVRQGAPLVINLSADPSTGFGWVMTSNPGEAVWLIGGPDYTPEPIPAGMMGVGGTTTWRFRALKPGTQTLEFAYLQSWEKGVAPTRTVRYNVTVKSSGWENWF